MLTVLIKCIGTLGILTAISSYHILNFSVSDLRSDNNSQFAVAYSFKIVL